MHGLVRVGGRNGIFDGLFQVGRQNFESLCRCLSAKNLEAGAWVVNLYFKMAGYISLCDTQSELEK
jgi:hypothetical protein